jgi:hypothetical protein
VDRSDKALLLLLAAALVAAAALAAGRARIERANRAVEIIIDADDARQLAMANGSALPEVLTELADAGASAVAVREMTIGDLTESGRITAVSAAGRTALVAHDPQLGAMLGAAIAARLPHASVDTAGPSAVITVGLDLDQLADVPVILRPEDIRAGRAAGLRLVARLRSFPAASDQAIEVAAAEAEAAGARLIICDKEEVLGQDGLLEETAAALERHDLLFGFVELAGQMGAAQIARRLADRLVRVHSISESDMLAMVPAVAVPRYARAVRERNVRACYLRLILRSRRDPVEHNVGYVRELTGRLMGEGFSVGAPAPFSGPRGWPSPWLRALVAAGVPVALVILVRRVAPLSAIAAWVLLGVAAGSGLAVGLSRPSLAVELGGLAAASILPSLGLVVALQAARGIGARVSTGETVRTAVGGLALASSASLAGALLVVGLYADVSAVAGVRVFAGVKLSLVLPLVLILLVVVVDAPGRCRTLGHWWTRTHLRLAQFLGGGVTRLQFVAALAALAALLFVLSRSGNQPFVTPSSLELKLRQLLESVLVIRPRSKEFLLGHPALMLAVALSLRGRRLWLPFVAVLAGVGQTSLVNTFSHFHTPLHVSVLRTGHGLWLGALLGVAVVLAWRLLLARSPQHRGP